MVVVGAIFAACAALALFYTTKISDFQPDDLVYSRLAIALSHGLGPLLHPTTEGFGRFNQLYMLSLAPVYRAFANPTAFEIAHVWSAVLMTSAVIPGYLLARNIAASRPAAYLAALLVGVCPWVTLSTGMTTEIAAYPAFVWAALALHRALVFPSWRSDLVALLAVGVAAFARLQLVVLVGVVVLAAVAHELGWAVATRAGRSLPAVLRVTMRRAARAHVLLLGVLVGGVAIAIALRATGSARLGFYSSTLQGNLFPPGSLASARGHLVYLLLGAGLVPGILAFAWTGANLVRPAGKRAHAFACLLAVAVPVLSLQVGSITQRFDPGYIQERYLCYVAPLLVVAMAATFGARRLAAPIAIAAVLVAALVVGAGYESSLSAFWFFDSPGLAFYLKVVAGGLHRAADLVGGGGLTPVQLGAVAALIVGAALVLLDARLAARWRLVAVGLAVTAFTVISTRYDFQQVVYGSFGGRGFGTEEVSGRDWVDARVPDGKGVAILAAQRGDTATSRKVWWSEEFWNRSIGAAYVLGSGPGYVWNAPRSRTLHFATGRLTTDDPRPYVVEPVSHTPLRLVGRALARSPDGRLVLLRAPVPYRAALAVTGASDDGWLAFDRPATVRVYATAGARRCPRVTLTLRLPRGVKGRRAFTVATRGARTQGKLAPGTSRKLSIVACARSGVRHADVRVAQRQGADPAEGAGVQLYDARVSGYGGRR